MASRLVSLLSVLSVAYAQQIGTLQAETHPTLTWQTCTASGCTTNQGSVTLDSNWRWLHAVGNSTNCYTGNTWNTTLCPDNVSCAKNCALDGAAYASTYGVTTSGNSLKIDFVTTSTQKNVGARLYLMASTNAYQMFKPLNAEFTFDVNVANLPCGLNGALYFTGMLADGGQSTEPNNKAGPAYGVGYCDSQCPRDLKFIAGQANAVGWTPATNSANTGLGQTGSCCTEMDIWEANSISNALTPHAALKVAPSTCTTNACGGTYSTNRYAGPTDPDGCDWNPYRLGSKNFYGPGMTVDTTKVFTVVTQFIGNPVTEIKRFYVQGGKVIATPATTQAGLSGNSITPAYCTAEGTVFNDTSFETKGGFASMNAAFSQGMVLVLSLWDDYYANMLWLDSTYPIGGTAAGDSRGTCATTSGVPATVEASSPGAYVVYSNIKFGAINSTFGGSTVTTSSAGSGPTGGTVPEYGQCGGIGYTGATGCVSPFVCRVSSAYYSQCLP
jgi:cellulose 1,4-beta-cellobiosidase